MHPSVPIAIHIRLNTDGILDFLELVSPNPHRWPHVHVAIEDDLVLNTIITFVAFPHLHWFYCALVNFDLGLFHTPMKKRP